MASVALKLTKTQREALNSVPYEQLVQAVNQRKREMQQKLGPYGSMKHLTACPHCKQKVGSRELRRHKRRINSECPARQKE